MHFQNCSAIPVCLPDLHDWVSLFQPVSACMTSQFVPCAGGAGTEYHMSTICMAASPNKGVLVQDRCAGLEAYLPSDGDDFTDPLQLPSLPEPCPVLLAAPVTSFTDGELRIRIQSDLVIWTFSSRTFGLQQHLRWVQLSICHVSRAVSCHSATDASFLFGRCVSQESCCACG